MALYRLCAVLLCLFCPPYTLAVQQCRENWKFYDDYDGCYTGGVCRDCGYNMGQQEYRVYIKEECKLKHPNDGYWHRRWCSTIGEVPSCGNFPTLENGDGICDGPINKRSGMEDKLYADTVCSFTCSPGFTLTGDAVVACEDREGDPQLKLNGSFPSCSDPKQTTASSTTSTMLPKTTASSSTTSTMLPTLAPAYISVTGSDTSDSSSANKTSGNDTAHPTPRTGSVQDGDDQAPGSTSSVAMVAAVTAVCVLCGVIAVIAVVRLCYKYKWKRSGSRSSIDKSDRSWWKSVCSKDKEKERDSNEEKCLNPGAEQKSDVLNEENCPMNIATDVTEHNLSLRPDTVSGHESVNIGVEAEHQFRLDPVSPSNDDMSEPCVGLKIDQITPTCTEIDVTPPVDDVSFNYTSKDDRPPIPGQSWDFTIDKVPV